MKQQNIRWLLCLVAIYGSVALWPAAPSHADDTPPPAAAAKSQNTAQAEPEIDKSVNKETGKTLFFPRLNPELRAIEGVLKVNYVNGLNGMKCIFAFFEGKAAARRWYFSPYHQSLLDRFHPDRIPDREPMFKVPEDVGPFMGLACFTPPTEPGGGVTQMAIELYKPLHGGFSGGGRFSPDEWKDLFEHYDQYDELEEDDPAAKARQEAIDTGASAVEAAKDAAGETMDKVKEEAMDKVKDEAMDLKEDAMDKVKEEAIDKVKEETGSLGSGSSDRL